MKDCIAWVPASVLDVSLQEPRILQVWIGTVSRLGPGILSIVFRGRPLCLRVFFWSVPPSLAIVQMASRIGAEGFDRPMPPVLPLGQLYGFLPERQSTQRRR